MSDFISGIGLGILVKVIMLCSEILTQVDWKLDYEPLSGFLPSGSKYIAKKNEVWVKNPENLSKKRYKVKQNIKGMVNLYPLTLSHLG